MAKLSVKDLSLKGQRVLLRADCNVPLDHEGNVADDARLRSLLPTLYYLIEQGASIVIMSHLGRPKGGRDDALSLAPVAERLATLLKCPVPLAKDCVGPEVAQQVSALQPGELLLLENLRFHKAETKPEKDPSFAQQLASFGDCYVNDAFGTAHRAHSSIVAVAQHFPEKAAAGLLVEKELHYLQPLVTEPERPFYAIIGGAKVSTKIGVLRSLCNKVDALLIGGAMANTFLAAQGKQLGNSLAEKDYEEDALSVINTCAQHKIPLHLPIDLVCSTSLTNGDAQIVSVDEGVPQGTMALDIGPQTIELFQKAIEKGKTIFWNGPLGVFEQPPFDKGTLAMAKGLKLSQAKTIVGGGDSVAAVNRMGVAEDFSHLSTGGGASLELLEHGYLPGIDILTNSRNLLQKT